MSKLDELFHEKLNHHSVTPSSEAWQRIEARLTKQHTGILWLRWAAVFLLGGLLLGVVWLQSGEVPVTATREKSTTPSETEKENKPAQAFLAKAATETKRKSSNKKSVNQGKPPVQEEIKTEIVLERQEEQGLETQAAAGLIAESSAEKPIVLVYTLEPVVEAHQVQPAVVASSEKKDSSLKRVLEFASTIKNGDSPLDNLRNAKEELFALDFRKKTNSKKQ